jgi:heme-degrading monooxygenase HmoA
VVARVARYKVPVELYDEALERLGEAAAEIERLEGFEHGYVLADAESGLVITTTIWRNRAALETSDVRASALRQRAIRAVEGSIECVDRLEVVAQLGATVKVD